MSIDLSYWYIILPPSFHLNIVITTFRRCQVWFLIWYCVLLQEAKRNLFLSLFSYGSTLGTNIYRYLRVVAHHTPPISYAISLEGLHDLVGRRGIEPQHNCQANDSANFLLPICVCPKTVSLRHFEFPHASVHALWRYRTYHCTSDSTTTTISSDADSMKFVTVFLRVNRCVWLHRTRTCNSLALAKRVPYYTISQYKPSLFIKPEATGNGCDDYFWKESCFW